MNGSTEEWDNEIEDWGHTAKGCTGEMEGIWTEMKVLDKKVE